MKQKQQNHYTNREQLDPKPYSTLHFVALADTFSRGLQKGARSKTKRIHCCSESGTKKIHFYIPSITKKRKQFVGNNEAT